MPTMKLLIRSAGYYAVSQDPASVPAGS